MPEDLTAQKCIPCEGNVNPLTAEQFNHYLGQVPGWKVVENKMIEREFKFKDFAAALHFINRVGSIAEEEGHHPDILLHNWNQVKIMLTTHAIKGLYINDFILAAKIDRLEQLPD